MGSRLITWRTLSAALAIAGLAGALALPDDGFSGRATPVAFRPVADAYVTASAPRRNFGKARVLLAKNRPRTRSYLRFQLSGVVGTLRRATLRVYVVDGSGTLKVAGVPSSRWGERSITFANAPTPKRASAFAPARRGAWSEIDVTTLVPRSGLATIALGASRGSIRLASREVRARSPRLLVDSGAPDPVVAAAGNIACDPLSPSFNAGLGTASECRQSSTSDLLVGKGLAGVLTLGDNQYACGGYDAYLRAFDPTWGRVKSLIHPVLGNHDYRPGPLAGTDCDPNGAPTGYFRYFGAAAGNPSTGYYSFDIGAWHLIALNTNCAQVGCQAGSAQEVWLRSDLAAHRNLCTLAYMHHPRFSSSYEQAGNLEIDPFWRALHSAGADVVLAGHDHVYERFAAQDPNGRADAKGLREFVVGTGGFSHHPFFAVQRNSQVRNNATFGVLLLTLRQAGYAWRFAPEAGASFADTGSGSCH
jgi:calcineurin-like phosphoesterase family protein